MRGSAEVAPVRAGEELDPARVEAWLREHLPGLPSPLAILQFPGGHANLTYLLRFGAPGSPALRELVLRRPPRGPLAPGSHDMAREYKVLSRLWRHYDRAPRAHLFCADDRAAGAPCFVMEYRPGVVLRRAIPDSMRQHADLGRRVSFALVDALADLHAVDYRAAGLEDLGRPEGFAERQLAGWAKRWELAVERELPAFEEVRAALGASLPPAQAPGLIHNDPKLDNCQFDPANPDRVQSVFDWDMCTLGDPLFDMGTLLAYWGEPGDRGERQTQLVTALDTECPSRAELAERYAARRGVSLRDLAWYEAFGLWKSAVVLQQLYIRWKRGQTQDARFAGLERVVPQLVRAAGRVLEDRAKTRSA